MNTNTKRYTNDEDDFEIINGTKCLKDGRTLRVPLYMMDSSHLDRSLTF